MCIASLLEALVTAICSPLSVPDFNFVQQIRLQWFLSTQNLEEGFNMALCCNGWYCISNGGKCFVCQCRIAFVDSFTHSLNRTLIVHLSIIHRFSSYTCICICFLPDTLSRFDLPFLLQLHLEGLSTEYQPVSDDSFQRVSNGKLGACLLYFTKNSLKSTSVCKCIQLVHSYSGYNSPCTIIHIICILHCGY